MFTNSPITSPVSTGEDIFDCGDRLSLDDVKASELAYTPDYAAECDKLAADYVDRLFY